MDKQLIQQAINTMQVATTSQQAIVPQHLAEKFRVINSLPENTLSSLPKITQLQVRSLMLKHTNSDEIQEFIDFVFFFVNPKFESEEDVDFAKIVLHEFAQSCSLTLAEMKEALQMASKGFLTIDDGETWKKIKLFREIDRLKLDEIEQAYIQFRNADYNHQKGLRLLKEILNPPAVALPLSQEAERQKKENLLREFAQAYKETGTLPMGSVQSFYLWLFKQKRLPEQTPQYIAQIQKRGKQRLRHEMTASRDAMQKREIKEALEGKENQQWRLKTACREIIMEDFFNEYLSANG